MGQAIKPNPEAIADALMRKRKPPMHYVSYAYPTSPMAGRLGFYKQGCWYLEAQGSTRAFTHRQEAIDAIPAGSTPKRWSADHPDNARFVN